jgi:hypothetical protein
MINVAGLEDTYMFWTGDNTAHDNPWYTDEEVKESLESIIDLV